ncbi:E3 ubiquitin-protein ligase TRIM71-like [Stylophora pistillata]|uniref:E3 ubiquitin-protein ligase TRIM71-like n=1 Tax=Stylophora pistillata TaxID=50429 RepID=UPI000C03DE42|nr:E3 ubiquitin-protein ligase TRIM71-like [Stylophora pistillata]
MESLLKYLKEHVTCSICLDTYTKPKTIACLHTFCCECLERHALTSQKGGFYRCPECQAQIRIPEGKRFDNLPSSFLHNSLLSLLAVRRSGEGNEISCSTCQKKSAEVNYCLECEKFMCLDCAKAHEVFRDTLFEGHKVTPVRQFKDADYEALLKRQSFCSVKYHEREITKFYCVGCQSCACQAADDEKANIILRAELVEQKKGVCRDVIREFEKTEHELEANITTAKRKVTQAVEQMMTKLKELEHEAVTALEKARVSRIEKLNSGKASVVSIEKQLDQALEFSNNLVERSSSSVVMQNKKNVEERIEDLMKTTMPVLPVNSFVEFVSTCEPESLSLGFTKFSKTDVQGSTVEGLVKNFRFGVETELLIRPKTSEGEIRNTRHTDRIEVHIEPADQVTSLVTSEREDGGFQTKFVAKVPGTYEMELKINEQKLAKSPFSIFLKSREFDVIGKLDSHGEMLQGPAGIAVNSKGVTAVAVVDGHCIMVFDDTGKFVLTLGVYGDKVGQFDNPTDVTFVNDDEILVADECNHRIQRFNIQTGKCVESFGKEGSGDGKLKFPTGVCITSDGRFIVVVDDGNSRIQVFTMDGQPVLKFGDGGPERLDQPLGCVCYEDKFIVTDRKNDCVKVFDEEGQFLYKFGEKGNGDGQLAQPYGLCTDKDGNVLVCDMLNNRIQMFSLEGKFIRKTSTDLKIQFPWGVTTTPDGQILVTDYNGLEVYTLK